MKNTLMPLMPVLGNTADNVMQVKILRYSVTEAAKIPESCILSGVPIVSLLFLPFLLFFLW